MKAYYHLPGLFEFYDLYRAFLPLFREKREWFYPWCDIGSIYGAPGDCLWGGGRVGFGDARPEDVAALLRILPHLQLMHLQLRTQLLLQTQLLLTTQLLLIPQLQLMRQLMLLLQLHQAVEGLQLQCLHSHQRDGSMTAQT